MGLGLQEEQFLGQDQDEWAGHVTEKRKIHWVEEGLMWGEKQQIQIYWEWQQKEA